MKKYRVRSKHSYYYYKKRKRQKKLIMIVVTFCFLIAIFFQYNIRTKRHCIDSNIQPVYFDKAKIKYDLYRVPTKVKGIYIPQKKVKDIEDYIQLAKDTQINAFVIDVKNDYGYLTFDSENSTLLEKGCILEEPPIEDIHKVMGRLYEENIYPIARIVVFKDNVIGKKYPDQLIKDHEGKPYYIKGQDTWLNPYDKRNWEYILAVCKEAIAVGFKEIQFDYVRFHESMDKERVLFTSDKTKTEAITSFVEFITKQLRPYGVYISADVFGAVITSPIDSEIVGQDFKELSKYLDYICPMVYPSHYARGTFGIEYPHAQPYGIILKSMEIAQDVIKQNPRNQRRAIIRPWLQDFTISSLEPYCPYTQKQLKEQIEGVYDAGLKEWMFWNAAGKYTQEGLDY